MQGERLLVITLSNIGDAIMTTPVLQALHRLYPEARIDIVADARSAEIFHACPYRDEIFLKHKKQGWRGLLKLVRELRRTRYRLIVDLRTDGLSYLLRGDRRCTKRDAIPSGIHAVQRSFAVIGRLPGIDAVPGTTVWLNDAVHAWATERLHGLPGRRWLALAPGANWAPKIWPLANYRALLDAVQAHFDAVILLGGPRDAEATAALAGASPLQALDLGGTTSLLQAAAVMQRALLLVGNDSGLGHLAAAAGTPTLTLFGQGEPERYHPWGSAARWLIAPDRDLGRLSAAAVAAEVRAMLEQSRDTAARPAAAGR